MSRTELKELARRCGEYRDNLRKAMRYLARSPFVNLCGDVQANCSSNEDILAQARNNKSLQWYVDINNWKIPITTNNVCGAPGQAALYIEGYITTENFPQLAQCITVSVILTPSKNVDPSDGYDSPILKKGHDIVVRRIHFDYDPAAAGHPRSHVQYGGNFRGEQHNQVRYELFERPKEPRIPYPPYDIVLCMDLILRQFETPLRPIVDDQPWVDICRESEKLLVKGYYLGLSDHISKINGIALHKRQLEKVDWL